MPSRAVCGPMPLGGTGNSKAAARFLFAGAALLVGCGSAGQQGGDAGGSAPDTDATLSVDGAGPTTTGREAGGGTGTSDGATTSAPDASVGTGGDTGAKPVNDASTGLASDAAATARPDAAASDAGASPISVVTNRYGNQRLGANTSESLLTVANVGGGNFGLLFSQPVDGHILAQPLYLPGLVIGGVQHNVTFVATEHDTVYAFDADAPGNALWTTSLGTAMDAIVSTNGWLVTPFSPGATVSCADMFPKSGVTSTPVIDPTTGRIYVVAKTLENGVYFHRLHALNVLTGQEVPGSPVVIQGSVPGTGISSDGGSVAFNPYHGLNRPGLLLMGGQVYIAYGSQCDDPPYHGWVFAYSASTLAQTAIFNVTPGGAEGSIWQSGMGIAGDGQGNVFFVSGNGDIDTTNKGLNLGQSVVRLQATATGLTLGDWWTTTNAATLNSADIDLQAGPMLLPNPPILVAGGKDGNYYSFDPANLGKFNPAANNILQQFSIGGGNHVHAPIYWNGPSGPTLYNWSELSGLRAFRFNGMMLNTTPVSQYTGQSPTHPGGILSLSSNGTVAGTGIVWASFTSATIDTNPDPGDTPGDAWHNLVPGAMYAFDASNLTTPIWTSLANKARDDIGIFAKYNAPMVANGKVYLGTGGKPDGGKLQVYGLLP